MLGYIISKSGGINVKEHKIQSFDVLHKTDLNIYVIKNGEVLYKNDIIFNASCDGHVQVLEWFKRSGYKFKYNKNAINGALYFGYVQVLEWYKRSGYKLKYDRWGLHYVKKFIILNFLFESINPKKVIKWMKHKNINILRLKTKKRYFKGYEKN